MAETMTCCTCRVMKPVDDFHRASNRPNGRYPSCKRCKAEREKRRRDDRTPEQIERDKARSRAKYLANREAVLERQRLAYPLKREQHRRSGKNRYLKRNYGLTLEKYEALLADQGGVCAVCRKPEWNVHPPSGRVISLAVDHDHTTGAVRGLLCRACNVALGQVGDDLHVLRRMIDYLERTRGR